MSGSQCCENPPNFSSRNEEAGRIEEIEGFKSYNSGSPDSKLAIILISDVFGFEAPKLRKIADKVAAAGFYAVVPDFFHGDPYRSENEMPVLVWIQNHLAERGCEDLPKIISAIKSRGASAVGAAGFCWGGMVIAKLSEFDDIQAGVILHPGQVLPGDCEEIKFPTAILGAELDEHCPPEELKKLGEILTANSVDNFVKIYPGVVHGWTTRYEDDNEHAVKSAMEAHSDMLDWFIKHLK